MKKCGYVAIVGPTNAGKSTLMNALLGQKVSIVSRKVQTTRCRINGVYTRDDTQIIFVDTPGLFDPKRPLERAMVDQVWRVLYDVDVILLVIDAEAARVPPDLTALKSILAKRRADQPFLLALNKCDQVHPKDKLMALAAAYQAAHSFDAVLMIAGEKGDGLDDLVTALAARLPEGPFFYPPDQMSDLPTKIMAAEATREHLFDRLHEELPYQMMVETVSIDQQDKRNTIIDQNIIVARDNHKGMVIGKGGATLKQIGSAARRDLEEMFGTHVRLNLHVVVDEKWMTRPARLMAGGLFAGDM